jgi:hypothetical protein
MKVSFRLHIRNGGGPPGPKHPVAQQGKLLLEDYFFGASFVLSFVDCPIRMKSACADSEIGATGWQSQLEVPCAKHVNTRCLELVRPRQRSTDAPESLKGAIDLFQHRP